MGYGIGVKAWRNLMKIMDAARYLIYLSYGKDNYSLTPLKLQKILYYVQGWSYVWDGVPVFTEEFEAWQYGPVNREVYEEFKGYKNREIPQTEGKVPANAQQSELETIESVWRDYGNETASNLVSMTHSEAPWREAYQSGSNITNEEIKEYFMNTY